jgi:hypothetical protein
MFNSTPGHRKRVLIQLDAQAPRDNDRQAFLRQPTVSRGGLCH